ncbi:Orf V, partial [Mucuna pruriens]
MILGTPFLTLLYPFQVTKKGLITKTLNKEICFEFIKPPRTSELNILKESLISKINTIERKKKHINMLNREIKFKRIEDQLKSNNIPKFIEGLENKIIKEICEINPTTIWHRKKYEISLPYIKFFNESNIPTKAKPIQMNKEYLEYSHKVSVELHGILCNESLLDRKRSSKIKWIRYPLPNKSDLIKRIQDSTIFSKFDMNSGYYQIRVKEQDRYKIAFVWNVMPQGLKNVPIEFQNIMNNIFNQYMDFSLVYIDDVLIFSKNINQHIEHLEKFINIIKENGLVIKIFQTKIRFLGFEIYQGTIKPIQRSIEFAEKFSNEIKDKKQLQRFLGCINYIANFIPNIMTECVPLYKRLRKNPLEWNEEMTKIVIKIKNLVKRLPCLGLPDPKANLIVEIDASDLGYEGILKQNLLESLKEQSYALYLNSRDPFLVYLVQTWNLIKVPKIFIDFGPVPTIFPTKINEAYNYFSEKSSFVPSYHLISFVASQEYTTTQQYETVDIKNFYCQTKVKWWKKFNNTLINNTLINKSKIDEWVNNNSKSTSQPNTSPLKKKKEEKEASFLLEKQKIMAELASATSVEEFEATLLKARSIPNSDNQDHSDVESSQSNLYLRNGDMTPNRSNPTSIDFKATLPDSKKFKRALKPTQPTKGSNS